MQAGFKQETRRWGDLWMMRVVNQRSMMTWSVQEDMSQRLTRMSRRNVCDVVWLIDYLTLSVECDLCAWQPATQKVGTEVAVPGVASDASGDVERSDLLQNLLGVSDAQAIDRMLDSADRAAALLGVKSELNSVTLAVDDVTVWHWLLMTSQCDTGCWWRHSVTVVVGRWWHHCQLRFHGTTSVTDGVQWFDIPSPPSCHNVSDLWTVTDV